MLNGSAKHAFLGQQRSQKFNSRGGEQMCPRIFSEDTSPLFDRSALEGKFQSELH